MVAALIDANPRDKQRIASLQANGHLKGPALIQIGEITGTDAADIEDLLDPASTPDSSAPSYAGDLLKPLNAADLTSKTGATHARQAAACAHAW